ncbi:hypothetical protein C9J01_10700 [Photobacterium rosenbergii]|uniref:Uncharacterized protein n=1 Tax=Photobacterium rosenbergii TaxID=294936 RepID=A0A2T3NFK1_9GAMM|nr:hypothetical protein [Photobacterium rosenbergii]PSW13312.1 hypothetical protein C9J01_10700 [Photobacterium rosenbergii]
MKNKTFFYRMLTALTLVSLFLVFLLVVDDSDTSPSLACQQSPKCWSKWHNSYAESECKPLIEKFAEYGVEWKIRFKHPLFNRSTLSSEDKQNLLYIGDRVQFVQADGSKRNMQYGCFFDTQSLNALDVVLWDVLDGK